MFIIKGSFSSSEPLHILNKKILQPYYYGGGTNHKPTIDLEPLQPPPSHVKDKGNIASEHNSHSSNIKALI